MGSDRNAPCPCGSGVKFKRCCGGPAANPTAASDPILRMDADHREAFGQHARKVHGPRWIEEFPSHVRAGMRDEHVAAFWIEWCVYHFPLVLTSIARDYLEHAPRVVHRAWLEARLATPLSVHEAVDIRPGEGLTLVDLLTGDRHEVRDVIASRTMLPREALLAAVVMHDGKAELTLPHPFKLPAGAAANVVAALKRSLRSRKPRVPREKLLNPAVMLRLINKWTDTVRKLLDAPPPRLQNMDGDAMIATIDHFTILGIEAEVRRRVTALDGAGEDRVEKEGDAIAVVVTRPASPDGPMTGDTVLGRVTIGAAGMRIETNSVARADALRARVEQACGGLIRHRAREHADPMSQLDQRRKRGARPPQTDVPPAEVAEVVRQMKEQHYAKWCDLPVPALGNITPREAAAGPPRARRALDVLLKQIETGEARDDAAQRFDVAALRARLGMASEAPQAPPPAIVDGDPWRALFKAIDSMRNRAPWDWMANEDVVGVVDDVTGTTIYATFLGAGGEMFGFLGYDGPEGWRSFTDMVGGSGDPLDAPYAQHALSAWLSDRDGLDPRMVRIIKQSGLKPRGRLAWPEVLMHRPGLAPHVPDDAHAGLMARVLPTALVLAETMRDAPPGRDDEILVYRNGDARRERRPTVMRSEPPPPPADPMTLARAAKQGRTGGTWHLDHWTLPAPITDRDPPWYPRQAIVTEIPRGLVLDMDVLASDAHPDAGSRDVLLRLVGRSGRPDRVVARRESVLRALEPLAHLFDLVHDPDPSWSLQLSESLGAALQRGSRGQAGRRTRR